MEHSVWMSEICIVMNLSSFIWNGNRPYAKNEIYPGREHYRRGNYYSNYQSCNSQAVGGGGEGRGGYLKYWGYGISTVNLLNRYEFEKHELNGQRAFWACVKSFYAMCNTKNVESW